jgi:hypothetical protein
VKRVNQYTFYQLGMILHPLITVEEGASLPQSVWELNKARAWIEFILGNTSYGLVVCRGAAQQIVDAINAVVPTNTTDFSTIDAERKLTWWEAYRIRNSASEFETVFAAELPTLDTYIVSKKGIYSTADLVERGDMAIDESARAHLSEEVLSDFRQAGRCLAFELATGAGFHTMRAVEAVLRTYWRLVLNPPVGAKAPEMAVCINELRAANESPKLMDILDHIRDLHRNTIMHPEVFLDMKDALRLFDVAKSAISAMADRVGELKEAAEIDALVEAAATAAAEAEATPAAAESNILMLDESASTVEANKSNGDATVVLDVPASTVKADKSDGDAAV